MAELRVRGSDEVVREEEAIRSFVEDHGLHFERWELGRLDETPQGVEEQEHILQTFAAEIERLKREGGYQSADVISVSEATPNLDEMLAKFDKEHTHSEDEVRFVVDGRGVFTIHGEDGAIFDVEVHPGDLLVVPEGTKHWFTLCEDRTIKCIRLFTSKEGWVANYTGAHPEGA